MEFSPNLRQDSDVPLYRQLFEQIAAKIRSGTWPRGERLPATRELAGQLGLNRTTISAAYELLESEGLITGQVGRGSFVTGEAAGAAGVDWSGLLERSDGGKTAYAAIAGRAGISFAMSRPSRALFPLDEFRASCAAVLQRSDLADILQLGSPSGYEPLRRYLMEEARRQGAAATGDDLLITNGCQQALDLIGRVLLRPGDTVAVEDPIYTGLKNLLSGMGAQLVGIPVGADGHGSGATGARPGARAAALPGGDFRISRTQRAPRFRYLRAGRCSMRHARRGFRWSRTTPTANCATRASPAVAQTTGRARRHGVAAEFFEGELSGTAGGLGAGAAAADGPAAARQGVGGPAHRSAIAGGAAGFRRIGAAGSAPRARAGSRRRAPGRATLESCRRYLPPGTRWTRPQGRHERLGDSCRSLWMPESCWRARRSEGVAYLPGRYFAVSRLEPGVLRLSFAGLDPEEIREGLAILGRVCWRAPRWISRHGCEISRTTGCQASGSRLGSVAKEHMFQFSSEQFRLKVGLAEMLKGGVIMDVTNAEQAKIAEDAGASAVMALERVPSDIRKDGGVARMANIGIIEEIMAHGHHSGDGQGAHRPLHGSADSGSAGRGLHRRERSPHAGRRRASHRQDRFQGAVRVRRAQPGRSAAAHCRRRGHDPHQGRSRVRATSWKRCGTSAPSSRR